MNKRLLKNITFDFAVIYPIMALYFFNDSMKIYAENALSFIGIFTLVIGVLSIFLIDGIVKSRKEKGMGRRTKVHSLYGNVSTAVEVIIFSMLGWYWVAVGFLIAAFIASMVDDRL